MAFGPGKDMFDSTKIIGEKQYSKAKVNTFVHNLLHEIEMSYHMFMIYSGTPLKWHYVGP